MDANQTWLRNGGSHAHVYICKVRPFSS
jgi:hypothetical protein